MPEWIWHWSGYVVALMACIGVAWALFWDRPRGRKRCRRCWYDMSGASDAPVECPECGRAHAKPGHLTRTRRRWGAAGAFLVMMMLGGYGVWVVPRVQERGALGGVPTAGLWLAAPWIEVPSEFQRTADPSRTVPNGPLVRDPLMARNLMRRLACGEPAATHDVFDEALYRWFFGKQQGRREIAAWWRFTKRWPLVVQADPRRRTESLAAYLRRWDH
ncbi:MAG: hypothetical protein AAFR96_02805 [Planctomycetota bacterium]